MKPLILGVLVAASVSAQVVIPATSPSIGGFTLGQGGCFTQPVTVTGVTPTGMTTTVSPETFPGNGVTWQGYTSAANQITIKVCTSISGFIGASVYDINVLTGSGGSGGGVTAVTGSSPITSTGGTTPDIGCPTCATGTPVATVTGTSPIMSSGGTNPAISCPTCATGTPVTTVTGTSPIVSSGGTTPAISCPTCGLGTVTAVTGTSPIVSSGGTTPALSCPTCAAGLGTGAGGGQTLALFTKPTLSEFTIIGTTTATLSNQSFGILATVPTSGAANYQSVTGLTAPWTIQMALLTTNSLASQSGLLLRAGASGSCEIFVLTTNSGVPQLVIQHQTICGAFTANVLNTPWGPTSPVMLQVTDDGTNRLFSVSVDLITWVLVFSEPRVTFAIMDRGGFTAATGSGFPSAFDFMHYIE